MPIDLSSSPALSGLIESLDQFLASEYPVFFGPAPSHPFLYQKRSKVIHDNIWGTNPFSWRELAVIDTPVFQRLRDIQQLSLAALTYPSARHTRFEHSLGVVTIATRIFDAVLQRQRGEFLDIIRSVYPGSDRSDDAICQLRQELRLAALLHDLGHSMFSHTSESVYGDIPAVREAVKELKAITAKEKKGAGEVLSFCLASTKAIRRLIEGPCSRLTGAAAADEYNSHIDTDNVRLLIVGRSIHPFLQFMGDIISSGFDADKLDYLLRDAKAAGLPLQYDLDRYLYSVRMEKSFIGDGKSCLKKIYGDSAQLQIADASHPHQGFESYKLILPRRALSALEQVVICKMMLFGYLYHHPKARSADGLMTRCLRRKVDTYRQSGEDDHQILHRFLRMTDSELRCSSFRDGRDEIADEYICRVRDRLLPREVYRFCSSDATHAERAILADFMVSLHDPGLRDKRILELETAIGEEFLKLHPEWGCTPLVAIARAGVWLDVPPGPKFEDVNTLVTGSSKAGKTDASLAQFFPISQWTQAYTHFRYYVRIFSFSEYHHEIIPAAKAAMQRVINIKGEDFYRSALRSRN